MPRPETFLICVDNGERPFYCGDVVSGNVVVEVNYEMKVAGIHMHLFGQGNVHWITHDGIISRFRCAKEEYLHEELHLWGGDGEAREHILQPGSYQFPFSFKLPEVPLPASYESHIGHVRYWLEARLDRPWKFDHVTKRAFTILERVDLNLSQEDLAGARRGESRKTVGCHLRCQAGPLTLTASTDRGGYCPGENILVTAHITNNSYKVITGIRAHLIRHVIYYARRSRCNCKDILSRVQAVLSIPAGSSFDWNQQPLPIPPTPPSSHTCRIIYIGYIVDVEVVIDRMLFTLHLNIPIVIGTEPLRSVYANTALPTIGWGQAEAVNIADNQYTMGQTQFAPLFPMLQLPPTGKDLPPQYLNPC